MSVKPQPRLTSGWVINCGALWEQPQGCIFKASTIIPPLGFFFIIIIIIHDGVISWLIPGVDAGSAGPEELQITPRFTPTWNRTTKCASLGNTLDIVRVGSIGLFDAIFRSAGLMSYMRENSPTVLPFRRLRWSGDESFPSR